MPDRSLAEQLDRAIESVLAGAPQDLTRALPASGDATELAALVEIAGHLRDMPVESFKTQLKAELERRAAMTTSLAGVSAGFRTITPFIIHDRAPELVDFIKSTFRAEELKRNTAGEAYGFYSEVRIGDSVIMIGGGTAARRGNLPGALHVYVEDCDAVYQRALDSGAVTLMGAIGEPTDRPYGERSAFVQDAFGNYWYIATRLASSPAVGSPVQDPGAVVPHVHPRSARKYIDFSEARFRWGGDGGFRKLRARHACRSSYRRRGTGDGRSYGTNGYPFERILFVRGRCRGCVCPGTRGRGDGDQAPPGYPLWLAVGYREGS